MQRFHLVQLLKQLVKREQQANPHSSALCTEVPISSWLGAGFFLLSLQVVDPDVADFYIC